MTPDLIVVNAAGTLGTYDPPGCTELLARVSPLPRERIAEVVRTRLQIAPELSVSVIAEVREDLLIAERDWPATWECGGFTPFLYADEALGELASIARVAVLSDVAVVTGPQRIADLRRSLGHHVDRIYTSYDLRARKPRATCWRTIATDYAVDLTQVAHIGDRVLEDVRGALHAGCGAVVLTNTRNTPVPSDVREDPRFVEVADLHHVGSAIASLAGAAPFGLGMTKRDRR